MTARPGNNGGYFSSADVVYIAKGGERESEALDEDEKPNNTAARLQKERCLKHRRQCEWVYFTHKHVLA